MSTELGMTQWVSPAGIVRLYILYFLHSDCSPTNSSDPVQTGPPCGKGRFVAHGRGHNSGQFWKCLFLACPEMPPRKMSHSCQRSSLIEFISVVSEWKSKCFSYHVSCRTVIRGCWIGYILEICSNQTLAKIKRAGISQTYKSWNLLTECLVLQRCTSFMYKKN